jgi:predicted glycosyltransferase
MEVFRELQPAVIVTEYFPFGRMQFASELIPLLQAARNVKPKPPIAICTLRDIVDNSRALQPIYDALTSVFCNHLFDAVLFHSDRRFARLEETFHSTVPLKIPVHYTGFVVPNINQECNEGVQNQRPGNHRDAGLIVTAGGGRAGAKLLFAAVDAYTRDGLSEQVRMTISTGPFMPPKERRALMERAKGVKGLRVKRWIKDLDRLLARARLSVSQCGYNTAVALLRARVPALLVPYALRKSDTEQMYRARKMEKLGVARIIRMERLTPEVLAREIRLALKLKPPKTRFDMNGARNALTVIEKMARRRAGNQSKRP